MNLFNCTTTGLFFQLNTETVHPEQGVHMSDIGPQPADRSDPGSTLVCVTTNVNSACCRKRDNPNNLTYGGPRGEWYFPNGTRIPRPSEGPLYLTRVGYTNQVRLAKISSSFMLPCGPYRCEVPELSNGTHTSATINILEQGKQLKYCLLS